MTQPSSTDAKNLVSRPSPKLPHERDESTDVAVPSDRPEIQQAYDDANSPKRETSKAEVTDATYNESVVPNGDRDSGVAGGRSEPDPAAKR